MPGGAPSQGSQGEQTASSDGNPSGAAQPGSGAQSQSGESGSILDGTAGTGERGGETSSSDATGDSGELVFEDGSAGGAGDALPDFSEEEALEEALEGFEDAMETGASQGSGGNERNTGSAGATAGTQGQGRDTGQSAGARPGDSGGRPGDSQQGGGQGSGSGRGPMTASEQIAILDEELNRGTGEFDDLILEERETIRRTAGNGASSDSAEQQGGGYPGQGSATGSAGTGGFEVPPMVSGSGRGGGVEGLEPRPGYDQEMPDQVAVYAPPADIPDGTDDDVVARQLREAAMREPDPELREKLWDEYRKYKGISE
jgi:hypothetical protein